MKKFSLISAALLSATSVSAAKSASPNVILILADDLGYGDISAYNPQSKIQTPNIDRLAKSGTSFTDAHSVSALSTPSRYGLLTGRYPWRTTLKEGVLNGYSPAMITPDRRTIAQMFSDRGYSTACIGKWHLGWGWQKCADAQSDKDVDFSAPITDGPTDRGFDYFYGLPASLDIAPYVYVENNRATSLPNRIIPADKGLKLMHGGPAGADFDAQDCMPNTINRSIAYVNERKGDSKPFFLYLPITAPHTPVLPANEYRGKTPIGDYGDFVVMIDDMVGRLVTALDNNGQLDNTIIIFTSDNGCAPYVGVKEMESAGHFPSYIYRGYKTDIYEGGHRIPLIVSWHNGLKERTDNSLVALTDLYATFAQMTGHTLANDEAVDSYSFWPNLIGKGTSKRKDMVYASGKGFLSLRTPNLKLVFHAGSGGWGFPSKKAEMEGLPALQLFDLNADPSEKSNLITTDPHDNVVKDMTATIRKYIADGRSTPGKKSANDTGNSWRQVKSIMK